MMLTDTTSKPRRVLLTLLALYAPYGWLFVDDGLWNWNVIRIWPFLPGVAISVLLKPALSSFSWIPEGTSHPFLVTPLLLGLLLLLLLRLRRAFHPVVAGLFVLSCAFSWIVHALLKA